MKVIVSLECRFDATPDGAIWTRTTFDYGFWARYLDVFEEVLVIARVQEWIGSAAGWKRADGRNVSFIKLPYYLGPWQFLWHARNVHKIIHLAVRPHDAVIMRVGSHIASFLEPWLSRTGHPYGLEVVGDPYTVFARGGVKHPLRPLFRWWFARQLRRQCASAAAVAYVTESALQQRYPSASGAYSTYYSSVELDDEAYVSAPRAYGANRRLFHLVHIGTMEQFYKAQDVLIRAVRACLTDGWELRVHLIGDGKYRQELEAMAKALGLAAHVDFRGQVTPGQAVRDWLDQADLFVFPSRTEGLPGAMVEAMARALPCIGSNVGGIPELLPPEDLVPSNDVDSLARKIQEVITDPKRMERMSARNLARAKKYHQDILRARRIRFLSYVKNRTLGGQ